jgi:hypothetical protein
MKFYGGKAKSLQKKGKPRKSSIRLTGRGSGAMIAVKPTVGAHPEGRGRGRPGGRRMEE